MTINTRQTGIMLKVYNSVGFLPLFAYHIFDKYEIRISLISMHKKTKIKAVESIVMKTFLVKLEKEFNSDNIYWSTSTNLM